jgi:hypothetical protein
MTTGLHAVNLANKWLNMLRGTAFTAPSSIHVKLHTGDPGAAGTSNASGNTTRMEATLAAASAGAIWMSAVISWENWAAGPETISHVTAWDAGTGGNFLFSGQLATARPIVNGDDLNLNTFGVVLTPLAA